MSYTKPPWWFVARYARIEASQTVPLPERIKSGEKRQVVAFLANAAPEQMRPNGQLLAAAPELLEALEDLYAEWRTLACQCISDREVNAGHNGCIVADGLPKVEAAILKAKGK